MNATAAVLTGDLIGSTSAGTAAVETTMSSLQDIARRFGNGTRFSRIAPETMFSRYRGDGWQMYIENQGLALAAALFICAELRATGRLESRISIGIGTATLARPTDEILQSDLNAATGSAFTASGRTLDSLKAPRNLALSGEGVDRLHARLISLLDEQISSWSKEQAEATALLLAPEGASTQQQIADHLNISRQAVASRLKAANAAQINDAAIDFYLQFSPEGGLDA